MGLSDHVATQEQGND